MRSIAPDGAASTSGGATISCPVTLASITACSATRYSSVNSSGLKSPAIDSMSEAAISSSWRRGLMSSSRKLNSAARTSSGHSMVFSTSTPSRTRSVASCSRWRSATFTIATRSDSTSASRRSTYGLAADRLRLEVVRLVVEDRVDLLGRHELMHVDGPVAGQRQVLEVLVGQDHHLAAAEVVALGDVVVADLLAADRAGALVPDAPAVARDGPGGTGCPSPRSPSRASPRSTPGRTRPRPSRWPASPAPLLAPPWSYQHPTWTTARVDRLREADIGWASAVGPGSDARRRGRSARRPRVGVRAEVGRRARARGGEGRQRTPLRAFRGRDHQGVPGARRPRRGAARRRHHRRRARR